MSDAEYEPPASPPSSHTSSNDPPEFVSRPRDLSEDDEEDYNGGQAGPPAKVGGYDSRIQQILYENPELEIVITHAGKNSDGGGNYIVYTIRTGVGSSLHDHSRVC